ncbi:MAG TPA: S24/S26 family peptidase, partial [Polyangia bacterium]|nr:S24/S26 family peptidase [Polyangia bacterium]
MQLRPEALRFVLAQGLPATIEVVGTSMEPTITKGAKVSVGAWLPGSERAGDVVLLATVGDGLLLHRVMQLFHEGADTFVVHQGDAPSSQPAVVARAAVLGRMLAFAPPDGRAAPTPDRLDAAARARFARRRLARRAR